VLKAAFSTAPAILSVGVANVAEYHPLTFWSNLRLGATYLSSEKAKDLNYVYAYNLSDINAADNISMQQIFEKIKEGKLTIAISNEAAHRPLSGIDAVFNAGADAAPICVLNLDATTFNGGDLAAEFKKIYEAKDKDFKLVAKDKNILDNVKSHEFWANSGNLDWGK
jgi:hypothetical protein